LGQIDSVDLYLSRSASADPGDASLVVAIYGIQSYTTRPNYGVVKASKTIDITNFPVHGSQDWVNFAFDTPYESDNAGFYGIYIYGTGNAYDLTGVRLYEASGDWSDASDGSPYTDKERLWRYTIGTSTWGQTGGSCAYRLNCSDGLGNNLAESPDASYVTSFNNYRYGIRSYIASEASPPGKARFPTPANEAEKVIIRGIDALKYLQWEVPA